MRLRKRRRRQQKRQQSLRQSQLKKHRQKKPQRLRHQLKRQSLLPQLLRKVRALQLQLLKLWKRRRGPGPLVSGWNMLPRSSANTCGNTRTVRDQLRKQVFSDRNCGVQAKKKTRAERFGGGGGHYVLLAVVFHTSS
jgi:hypothetical protein